MNAVIQGNDKELTDLVRQIVERVHPLQVVLFGSAARGEAAPGDWDLMVLMPEGTHRRRTSQLLYANIHGITNPFDLVVATPSDLERYGQTSGLIYKAILHDGRALYAA